MLLSETVIFIGLVIFPILPQRGKSFFIRTPTGPSDLVVSDWWVGHSLFICISRKGASVTGIVGVNDSPSWWGKKIQINLVGIAFKLLPRGRYQTSSIVQGLHPYTWLEYWMWTSIQLPLKVLPPSLWNSFICANSERLQRCLFHDSVLKFDDMSEWLSRRKSTSLLNQKWFHIEWSHFVP